MLVEAIVIAAARTALADQLGLSVAPPLVLDITLTGVEVVDTVVTELCLIEVTDKGLVLKELRPDVTVEDVQRLTGPRLIVQGDPKRMEF